MINKQQKNNDVFEIVMNSTTTGSASFRGNTNNFEQESPDWFDSHQEGQLAIDVVQTHTDIIVVSTMAGAKTSSIEVYVHNDLLTIRGERENPLDIASESSYVHQECFWGKFSRSIVLPVHVKGDQANAEYKNGVLKVTIPKRSTDVKVPIEVVEN